MKNLFFSILLSATQIMSASTIGQSKQTPDSLGLPGDNLNLFAVLELFQKAETVEGFEKSLNESDWKVNNLDLNGDDKIDYISVKDNVTGTSHAIVLQTAINEKETQDIAVIEVEKVNDENVNVQIVGDEDLYGKNYIVEPKDKEKEKTEKGVGENNQKKLDTSATEKKAGSNGNTYVTNNYYNNTENENSNNNYQPAAHWHVIHYIYVPTYVVYVSPWRYGYFPGWWNPWTPLYWHEYYGFHRHYFHHPYYHRGWVCRTTVANGYYRQHRSTSVVVAQRREKGAYKTTYSHPELKQKGMNDHKQQRQTEHQQTNAHKQDGRNEKNNAGAHQRNEPKNQEGKNRAEHDAHKNNEKAKNNAPKAEHRNGGQHQQNKPANKGGGGGRKK